MSFDNILNELRDHRTRLDEAIAALQGTSRRGRPPKARALGSPRMSPAARARIGAAKKAWWAKQKAKTPRTKSKPKIVKRSPMSPAARKKVSALMKARWADRKKAA